MDGQHNDFSFYGFNIHSPKSTLVGTSAYGSQQENPLELEAKLPETAQKMEQMMPSIPRRRGSGKGNPQNPKILLMIMTNQDHPGIFIRWKLLSKKSIKFNYVDDDLIVGLD